jgi:hypothetical protein
MESDKVLKAVQKCRDKIVQNIDTQKIKASGKTQESLRAEDRGDHIVLVDAGDGAPFETLKYGRPSGAVPKGFQSIILQWMEDKGIKAEPIDYIRQSSENWKPKYTPQQRGQMKRAGQIAGSIKKSGTKRNKSNNNKVYDEPINDLLNELAQMAITDITLNFRLK